MLNNLDILRAFAVTCVLVAHIIKIGFGVNHPALNELGYFGVLAFFVHTSIVLMRSLDRTPPAGRWTVFYVRRFFRIYPLSITVILILLAINSVAVNSVLLPNQATMSVGDIVANLLLIQNLTDSLNVTGPLWSLPYEVQMYLVLPYIHEVISGSTSLKPVAAMLTVMAALNGVLFVASGWHPITQYFPCFLCGVLAHQLLKKRLAFLPGRLWPVWLLALMVPSVIPWLSFFEWRSSRDTLICLVLAVTVACFKDVPSGRLSAAASTVAKYSYGVYLLHMPLILFCFQYLKPAPAVSLALFCVLCTALPFAAYHCIEAPMMAYGRTNRRPVPVSA